MIYELLIAAQTLDVKRLGLAACECQTSTGVRISGHTSDIEAIDACGDLVLKDRAKRRLVCSYELSATFPAPPVTPPVTPPTLGTAALTWTRPTMNTNGTPLTDLSTFKIYYGTNASSLAQSVSVPGNVTTYTVESLAPGTWFFSMTATNSTGVESARTNLASKVVQ